MRIHRAKQKNKTEMKNMQFRKLAAVAGTALMAGLSMAGPALAAGVTNVADIGSLAGASDSTAVMPTFVVGKDAQPADVAAAINLASYLAGNVYKTESVAVTGGAAAADGVTFRTELQNTTALTRDFDTGTTDVNLQPPTRGGRPATFLKEGSFTISGTEYKFYEKVLMSGSNLQTTSGYYVQRGSSDTTYENAYKSYGVSVPNDKVIYGLFFDTASPVGTNNLTSQTIKFLGVDYTVSSSSTSKVELAPVGGSVGLKAGESATVGSFTVKVDSIATASGGSADVFVSVCKGDVCSQSTSFRSGDTKTLTVGSDSVGVTISSVAYGASASVLVGTTSIKLENAQTLTAFPNWRAGIGRSVGGSGNEIANLTITYVQPHSSFTGTYPILEEGKSLVAPNNFFVLKNMGYESRDYYRLTMTTGSNSNFGGGSSSTEEGVVFKLTNPTSGAAMKVWDVGGGTFSDQVAYDMTNGAWRYLNTTTGWQTGTGTPQIQLTESTLTMAVRNTTASTAAFEQAQTATLSAVDMVFFVQEPALTESGFSNAWSIVADYNYGSNGYARFNAPTDLFPQAGSDTDYLLYGRTLKNDTNVLSISYGGTTPKARAAFTSNFGSKLVSTDQTQIVIDIPKAQNYIGVLYGREAGAATGGSATSKTPIQITFDVAKLDSEISDASKLTTDTVIMGGPAVNTLAAQLLGKTYPAKGADSGIPENAALVQVFQNAFGSGKVAVLVAGWEAEHTDLAVAAIQAGKVTLAEPKVKISGSVAAPAVEKL